ncbi:MAG: hypothetical protein HPY44_01295 [Armatimonadetes bacterium]|nr:hypothetical protein [Armatimonadota bacterium]
MPYALLFFLVLMACCPVCARDWALVAYLDGRGDLGADAVEHAGGMLRLPGANPVHVAVSGAGGGIWSRENGRVTRFPGGAPQAPISSERGLSDFLEWVRPRTQGYNRLVCLLGHGAPAAAGAGTAPFRLLHADDDPGITPDQLAECLRGHLGSEPDTTTVVVLETCFSASADSIYALRDVADFVLVAPGEVPSPGLPWPSTALAVIAAASGDRNTSLSEDLSRGAEQRWMRSWTLLWVQPGRFESVVDALQSFCEAAERSPETCAASLLRLRASTSAMLERREMVELARLARTVGNEQPGTILFDRGQALATAAEQAAVQHVVLGPAGADSRGHPCGITVYLPGALGCGHADLGSWSSLAKRTGYDRLIEFYVQYCGRLVPGLGPTA